MINTENKQKIIKEFSRNEKDTGSPEVQIALLTARINYLTEHFKQQPKDFGSRRGLLRLVGQRRGFLEYLKSQDNNRYTAILNRLGLRK